MILSHKQLICGLSCDPLNYIIYILMWEICAKKNAKKKYLFMCQFFHCLNYLCDYDCITKYFTHIRFFFFAT